jgi:hypothetical protein
MRRTQIGIDFAPGQRKELLNSLLLKDIERDAFATNNTEVRDGGADLKLKLGTRDRGRHENTDIAVRACDLNCRTNRRTSGLRRVTRRSDGFSKSCC